MVKPKFHAEEPTPPSGLPAPAGGQAYRRYFAGGQVGQMQDDLAHCLAFSLARDTSGLTVPVSPGERLVRFLSVVGGYIALLAAYAGAALLILR